MTSSPLHYKHDMAIRYEYPGYSFKFLFKFKSHLFRSFLAQERIRHQFEVGKRLRRIRSLRTEFAGPALVIANGPSAQLLSDHTFNHFSNTKSVFTINDFYASGEVKLMSNFHLVCDRGYWSDKHDKVAYRNLLSRIQQNQDLVLIQPDHLEDYTACSTLYIRKNPLPTFKKSIRVDKISGLPNNTAFFAIATALYLGFSPVYVAGLSLNYYRYAHFEATQGWKLKNHHFYDLSTSGFYEWDHRDSLTKILNYNLFLISQLSIFKYSPVTLISDERISEDLPYLTYDEFNRSFQLPK